MLPDTGRPGVKTETMFTRPFVDRVDAGRQLAEQLGEYRHRDDVIVLALPRGGVPVGFEVARTLAAPLDVLIVRKLGAPGQPELALGAIASGDIIVINEDLPSWLRRPPGFEAEVAAQRDELRRRERAYRNDRPAPVIEGRTVILADDGAATGSSMVAAVRAARQLGAREIVVALPVSSGSACEKLRELADRVVCILVPDSFFAVGQWYQRFPQTSDEEVRSLLALAAPGHDPPAQATSSQRQR